MLEAILFRRSKRRMKFRPALDGFAQIDRVGLTLGHDQRLFQGHAVFVEQEAAEERSDCTWLQPLLLDFPSLLCLCDRVDMAEDALQRV